MVSCCKFITSYRLFDHTYPGFFDGEPQPLLMLVLGAIFWTKMYGKKGIQY